MAPARVVWVLFVCGIVCLSFFVVKKSTSNYYSQSLQLLHLNKRLETPTSGGHRGPEVEEVKPTPPQIICNQDETNTATNGTNADINVTKNTITTVTMADDTVTLTHTKPKFTMITSAYGKYPTRYPIANALKNCYALRHGYQNILDVSEPESLTEETRFRHKIEVFRKYLLKTSEFAVFLDADLVIYNLDAKLEQFVDDDHDVYFMDGFELSSCVWIVRNSEWGRRFVDNVLATFEINNDDQGGITNLIVTMLNRQKLGLKDILPPISNLKPDMPCGLQGELGLDEHLYRANNCLLKAFDTSMQNKRSNKSRTIGRLKLLSPFEPTQRLMAYCCHGNAPPENKWLNLTGRSDFKKAQAAIDHGQIDPVLFVSGRSGEKGYEAISKMQKTIASTCNYP